LSASSSPPSPLTRRAFVGGAVGGIGLLTFIVAGCEKKLTPTEARRADVPLRTLTAAEAATLEALGEILLPGSAAAGLVHYIDHQISSFPGDSMLIVKYLGVNPPYVDFYRPGLAGVDAVARATHGKSLAELDANQGAAVVGSIAGGQVQDWTGPPAGLFYFTLRSDAIDVVYGTQRGFESLGVPYMPHIVPPTPWGA
jgi:hypothetical protein